MLLAADVMGALVRHLTDATLVPFSTETPTTVPSEYGRCQHLTGYRSSLVLDSQDVHVRVWAATARRAWLLARVAHAAVIDTEGRTVHGVHVLSASATMPAWFPDPDTRGPSYVFTATLLTEAVEE